MKNLFSLFILSLLVAIPSATNATEYFVDASSGNDDNPGTIQSAAWKTLAKVGNASLAPGDSVNLKCGQIWRETLNLRNTGTAAQPIFFGSYGDCSTSKPEIRGSTSISGWAKYSGSIYVASLNNTATVSQLFIDGKLMRLARHPNTGYWSISKSTSSQSNCTAPPSPYDPFAYVGTCTIDLLLAESHPEITNNDLSGAKIRIKTQSYWIDKSTIASYDRGGTAVLDKRTRYLPKIGNGYYLENKLWMLDVSGEWFYDKAQGKLYAWLPDSSNPNAHTMEASTRDYGIFTDSQKSASYTILSGLLVNQTAVDGIHIESSSNIQINDVEVKNSGHTGILVYGSNSTKIQSSKITNSANDGIKLRQSHNSMVSNNTLIENGTPGFYLDAPDTSFAAIATDSSTNTVVTQNTITNAGYIGIRIQIGSTASNNTINNTCLVLLDCGAIYVNGTGLTNSDPRSMISNNIISNVGTTSSGLAAGIYLDDFANHVSVINNTITNAERGIFLHLAHDNSVMGNTVNGSRAYSLSISENISSDYAGVTHNNMITGNKFSQTNGREIVNLTGAYGNINFATFSANNYSISQSNAILVQAQYKPFYPSEAVTTLKYTLSTWQMNANQDSNSTLITDLPSPPKGFTVGSTKH